MQKLKQNKILALMLVVGLLCTLLLCGIRVGFESADKVVSIVMTEDDVRLLAEAEGVSYEQYLSELKAGGLTDVFVPDVTNENLNLFLGEVHDGSDATVGLIEDKDQHVHNPIEGFTYESDSDVVRVFKLLPYFASRYAVLGYEGYEEILNIFYRAVSERNVRVLWMTPFTHTETGEVISDIEEYTGLMEDLAERMEPHGMSYGEFTTLPPYEPNLVLILGVLAGVTACGVILITSVFKLSSKLRNILFFPFYAAAAGCFFVYEPGVSLVVSILFPCLAIWYTAYEVARVEGTMAQTIWQYIKMLFVAFIIVMLGGLCIAALNSERAYLLSVETFIGVKLSQSVPLVYALLIFCKYLYPKKNPIEILSEYKSNKMLFVLGVVAIVVIVAVFLLRTGHQVLPVSDYEQRFRNFLEEVLLARPRTKEFLIAWPVLGLGVTVMARWGRKFALPLTGLSSIGFASAVNSFCHYRTPIYISLSREFIGLAFGVFLGLVAMLCAEILHKALCKKTDERMC